MIADEPNSPVGLPKGLAEQVVKHAFFKWKPQETVKTDLTVANEVVPEVAAETVIENTEIIEEPRKSLKVSREKCFTSSESYNGAVYTNYSWSQTISDVDIIVKVPENITTKNLSVAIHPNSISVRLKDSDEVLLEGGLCKKCKHTDAIWSIDKTRLEIHLDKSAEIWWDCLVQNEPRLDLSKIDCSRPFEELSDEAQAKIEELTWNQERKRLGLPTSEEIAMQEKLKKGWNVEGSPFKGPYDPNAVIFN